MMYASWDMVRDGCNYFLFWAIFCPFTPVTSWKMKILKKWKKHLEISPFYICVLKIIIIRSMVPEIWCVTDAIVISHFGLFFALLPRLAQRIKILKKKKKTPGDIINLYKCTKNYDQVMYGSWDMVRDGRTEKVTYRGGCPT